MPLDYRKQSCIITYQNLYKRLCSMSFTCIEPRNKLRLFHSGRYQSPSDYPPLFLNSQVMSSTFVTHIWVYITCLLNLLSNVTEKPWMSRRIVFEPFFVEHQTGRPCISEISVTTKKGGQRKGSSQTEHDTKPQSLRTRK